MVHPDNLNADGVLPQTRAHSDAIAKNLELGQAWDDFGLVADIVVHPILFAMGCIVYFSYPFFHYFFLLFPFLSESFPFFSINPGTSSLGADTDPLCATCHVGMAKQMCGMRVAWRGIKTRLFTNIQLDDFQPTHTHKLC